MDDERRPADREVAEATRALAGRLRASWPPGAMEVIDGDLEYGQWSEAVLDILALGRRDGLTLAPGEREAVDRLVDTMELHGEVARMLARQGRAKAGGAGT